MTSPSRRAALALCAALSVSACYSPSPSNGALVCSASGSCPDGYRCASNGYCYQLGAAVPPDAPTQVTAQPGVRSAQISWTAPADDGGSAITSYTITSSPGGATASSSTTSASLSGLDNSTAYTFTVVATNAIGNSLASAPSAAITTYGFPGAPTALVAASVAHGATLDWTGPADAGGTPVTGYIVQVSLNGGAYTHVSPAISGTHAQLGGLSAGGSYTFEVAAVNAVGAGDFSAPSAAIVLADVPATPAISAPAAVSAGQAGVTASVPANEGETYAWTIAGGTLTNPDGAAGEVANGADAITFTVTAAPGGQVVLTCVATNAIGASAPGMFTSSVSVAPVQPTIAAARAVTLGDSGITAQVVAHEGMTYSWTLSSNATLTGSDLHGVTAGGFNTITYALNGSAQVGTGALQLAAVEVNASQVSSAPGLFAQDIAAVPVTPIITAPAALAAGELGASASVQADANMTYAWTLSGASFSSGSGAAGTLSGGLDSILYDVTAAAGGSVVLSVVEINEAGRQSTTPAQVSVPVSALPGSLAISIALENGASPAQFQSGADQYVTLGNPSATAQVASIPGATYAWTISGGGQMATGETGAASSFHFSATSTTAIELGCTVALGTASATGTQVVTVVAAPVQPSLSIDGAGPTGYVELGDTSTHHAAVTAPVSTSSYAWSATPAGELASLDPTGATVSLVLSPSATAGAIALDAVETNAAGKSGTAGVATLNALAAPPGPIIDVPALDGDVRSPKALTYGATNLLATVAPDTNPDGSAMSYACSADANATLLDTSTPGQLTFEVSSAPTSLDGSGNITTTLSCTETSSFGASTTGALVIPLSPPLAVALSPENGTVEVPFSVVPFALFSYAPDPSSLRIDASCGGNVQLTGSDGSCVLISFAQDATNPALFTFPITSALSSGVTYTLSIYGGPDGVADLQGVPLGATTSASFTLHAVPDIDPSTVTVAPHLQSLDLAWTNPADGALDHVTASATWTDDQGTAKSASVRTSSPSASSLSISGIDPNVDVQVTLQVAEDAAGLQHSAGIALPTAHTAFSGAEVDFLASQTVQGLGPQFDGAGAAKFSVLWDSTNLYLALEQADGAAAALRNDGDALWVGIDVDGSGDGDGGTPLDVNGETSTPTGGTTSAGLDDQILWPFRADYVIELKRSGTALVANLRTVADAGNASNGWAAIASPVDYNGTLAELMIPPPLLDDTPYDMRFAMAFLNTPAAGAGTVLDLAPAGYASDASDGHAAATDVLGKLASIANSIDPQGGAFRPGQGSLAHRTPAQALVTLSVDAAGQGFSSSDPVQLDGSLAPFSYTLSDSSYLLADDGTRGDASAGDGVYTGVFNLGIFDAATAAASPPLFFEFTHNGAAEPLFGGGADRVYTLAGSNETVGAQPIPFGAVYSSTHSFQLLFTVSGVPGASGVTVSGNVSELTDWGAGVPLAGGAGTWSGQVTFTDRDFVSGGSNCGLSTDAPGCPLNWKAVADGTYEDPGGGNDSMNDDVINFRPLAWTWGAQTSF